MFIFIVWRGIYNGAYDCNDTDYCQLVLCINSLNTTTVVAYLVFLWGAILLFISVVYIIAIVDDDTETTEKVVGKGTIVTEIDFNYFNGGKDSSNEIKYFIEVECGNKIVVDESAWKEIKDEHTYIPNEAEIIEED